VKDRLGMLFSMDTFCKLKQVELIALKNKDNQKTSLTFSLVIYKNASQLSSHRRNNLNI